MDAIDRRPTHVVFETDLLNSTIGVHVVNVFLIPFGKSPIAFDKAYIFDKIALAGAAFKLATLKGQKCLTAQYIQVPNFAGGVAANGTTGLLATGAFFGFGLSEQAHQYLFIGKGKVSHPNMRQV